MNNNITNTGIFLKQSAVSLRSKFSDFTGKGGANTDSPSYRFYLTQTPSFVPLAAPCRPATCPHQRRPNPVDNTGGSCLVAAARAGLPAAVRFLNRENSPPGSALSAENHHPGAGKRPPRLIIPLRPRHRVFLQQVAERFQVGLIAAPALTDGRERRLKAKLVGQQHPQAVLFDPRPGVMLRQIANIFPREDQQQLGVDLVSTVALPLLKPRRRRSLVFQ